jgi:hypothetical protein
MTNHEFIKKNYPKEMSTKIIKNSKKLNSEGYLEKKVMNEQARPSVALGYFFIWKSSKEGHKYWQNYQYELSTSGK